MAAESCANGNFEETDLQSKNAEIFRAKIISDYHLLDHFTEGSGVKDVPCYYTEDITDPETFATIMKTNRTGLVRFRPENHSQIVPQIRRRVNRVKTKNSKWPPLDILSHTIISSNWFQNLILTVILINCVVLGVQAELTDRNLKEIEPLLIIMDIFDYFSLVLFMLEILLKWTDEFWLFWKNNWNVFDFIVTFLTLIPEVIQLWSFMFEDKNSGDDVSVSSDLAVVATNLRTFRVLRSLKMVSRFKSVKIIVLAVTKAFQAMIFITILLFIFAYIFAVIGVVFFRDGYRSAEEGQLNQIDSFSSLGNALITLFQLFTLDRWFGVYQDTTNVTNYFLAATYMMLWILLGSFIFKNIFVGIMVNNFQNIRNDLYKQMEQILEEEARENEMIEFAGALEKQMQRKASEQDLLESNIKLPTDDSDILRRQSSRFKSKEDMKEALSIHLMKTEKDSNEWQKIVEKNLENLARENTTFCWPKDTLFLYFLKMEALMENLYERQKLLKIVSEALLQIHDG